MPALDTGKVLVTGANGFIGAWTCKTLLERGFSVRGTVRNESKATHLRKTFASFGDKFEIAVVEDMLEEGAFDSAVQGVDAIVHGASPFDLAVDDPAELIDPAVKGTTTVLTSALKHAPTLRRFIVTSSTGAMNTPSAEMVTVSEADWNEGAIAEINEKGAEASPLGKYCLSKTLAERTAWDFYNKHKGEVGWDMVSLNPPYVFGPVLHEVDKPEKLNTSMVWWYGAVVGGSIDNESLANVGVAWVDVRDMAEAYTLALTTPEASGERFIISAGPFKLQDFVSIAHRLHPQLHAGNTEYNPAKAVHYTNYVTDKQRKLLPIKYRTIEELTGDTLENFQARGWF
ncbi:NAD(P)-binding protein [Polyporus arcularius HHB13444]|uniref:NAD(P)-binding protein n=1 Tax=Polyporus arcularius HHB13444 TaxID=1314778 RepID=A0A5C3NUK9_9APHY|nr:NAD(P)-binding protein [Polyporus arcularius HHB13444]